MSDIEALRASLTAAANSPTGQLTVRQLAMLVECVVDGDQTVRGLSQKLGVARPTVTRNIDALSERQMVRRFSDPTDKRSVLIRNTSQGLRFVRKLI